MLPNAAPPKLIVLSEIFTQNLLAIANQVRALSSRNLVGRWSRTSLVTPQHSTKLRYSNAVSLSFTRLGQSNVLTKKAIVKEWFFLQRHSS